MSAWPRLFRFLTYAGVAAIVLAGAARFGVLHYKIGRTARFCAAVASLPAIELSEVASQCDRLMWERGGPEAGLQFIHDSNVLSQFRLIGREPYEVVVEKGTVALKYHQGHWRYSDLLVWGEDYSSDGDRIRSLRIIYGAGASQMLCQRSGPHGEPDGAANRSQPFRSQTNQASAAAGSGR